MMKKVLNRKRLKRKWEKSHLYIPTLARLLGRLVSKKEVSEQSEEETVHKALNKDDVEVFESSLLELVCAKNIEVKRKWRQVLRTSSLWFFLRWRQFRSSWSRRQGSSWTD